MRCIKTGFYASFPHGFLYGDAFIVEPDDCDHPYREEAHEGDHYLLLRICSSSLVSEGNPINIVLANYDHWFDEKGGKRVDGGGYVYQPNSTLLAAPRDWQWLGYDGRADA